jgi:hypothetical protein
MRKIEWYSLDVSSVVTLAPAVSAGYGGPQASPYHEPMLSAFFFPFPIFQASMPLPNHLFCLSPGAPQRTQRARALASLATTRRPGLTDSGFTTDGMAASHAYKMLQAILSREMWARTAVRHLLRGTGTVVVGLPEQIYSASTPRFSAEVDVPTDR